MDDDATGPLSEGASPGILELSRASFLARAGEVLAGSLDYETTLTRLAELAVPFLADWCTVDMLESDGALRRLAVAHADPDKAELADRLRVRPPDRNRQHPVWTAVGEGTARILPDLGDGLFATIAHDDDHFKTLRDLGSRACIIAPLIARDRVLGAITFMAAESGRGYSDVDLTLAEDLARRAAVAVDHARLYRNAQEALADRDRALVAVEAERARLRQILEVFPEAVLLADQSGRFVLGNAAAVEIIGREVAGERVPLAGDEAFEAFGTRYLDGHPYPASELPLERALLRGETIRGEQFLLRNALTTRDVPILASSAPLLDADGDIVGAVVVFQDISGIKDLERSREEFLSSISHDLKTPLTTIRGLTQLAQRLLGRGAAAQVEQAIGRLDAVVAATDRMTALINELLDVARLHVGGALDLERRPVDLIELSRRVVTEQQMMSPRHRIRIGTRLAEFTGQWDSTRLERALTNLLANAVKYSPDGGTIRVAIYREERSDGSWARVAITDPGIGIPPADLTRVFDRFYRGSNVAGRIAGTGIGLATVRQIVEQHGGTIDLASQLGDGTQVTIRLPASRPASQARP